MAPSAIGGPSSSYTRPEPLVQSNDAEIASLASRIAGGSRDPRLVAERMNTWVHDSLKKELTFGIPSALDVLHQLSQLRQ